MRYVHTPNYIQLLTSVSVSIYLVAVYERISSCRRRTGPPHDLVLRHRQYYISYIQVKTRRQIFYVLYIYFFYNL